MFVLLLFGGKNLVEMRIDHWSQQSIALAAVAEGVCKHYIVPL